MRLILKQLLYLTKESLYAGIISFILNFVIWFFVDPILMYPYDFQSGWMNIWYFLFVVIFISNCWNFYQEVGVTYRLAKRWGVSFETVEIAYLAYNLSEQSNYDEWTATDFKKWLESNKSS